VLATSFRVTLLCGVVACWGGSGGSHDAAIGSADAAADAPHSDALVCRPAVPPPGTHVAPGPGDVGADCASDADCPSACTGTCPTFGAAGLGCTKVCTSDAECGDGNYCIDFAAQGYPMLGTKCVHGCDHRDDDGLLLLAVASWLLKSSAR